MSRGWRRGRGEICLFVCSGWSSVFGLLMCTPLWRPGRFVFMHESIVLAFSSVFLEAFWAINASPHRFNVHLAKVIDTTLPLECLQLPT